MKKDIRILIEEDREFYPASSTEAVGHDQMKTSLTNLINKYNVSTCYPDRGVRGNQYDLTTAVNLLNELLEDNQKIPGVCAEFTATSGEYECWEFFGRDFTFDNILGWRRIDSSTLNELLEEVFPVSVKLSTDHVNGLIRPNTSVNVTFFWNVYRKGQDVTIKSIKRFNGELTKEVQKTVTIREPEHKKLTFTFSGIYQGLSASTSTNLYIVDDCYYGLLDPTWSTKSEGLAEKVLTLSKTSLKNTKNFSWTNINMNVKKFCYAYPTYHGRLSHIIGNNNMDYIDSYDYTTVMINGINYYVYVAKGQTSVENYQQIYS